MLETKTSTTVVVALCLAVTTTTAFTSPTALVVGRPGTGLSATEEDGMFIKSVNAKEICFDEKTGRFYETKFESGDDDDDKKSQENIAGPFPSNPFSKPQGTFFDDLFSKKDESASTSPAEPATPSPPKAAPKLPSFNFFQPKEEKEEVMPEAPPPPSKPSMPTLPSFDFFQPKQETKNVAPPPPVATRVIEPPPPPPTKKQPSFLDSLFQPPQQAKVEQAEEEQMMVFDPVSVRPDFKVALIFLAAAWLLDQIPYIQWALGFPTTLLGILFLVQTFRVRFVFNEQNQLEIRTIQNIMTGELKEEASGNVVVGGTNNWDCDTIVNYDFFPSDGPVPPILVYFKETQTPSDTWNQGPGMFANAKDKIQSGEAVAGQVHFFPAVCSTEQIQEEFEKRGCGKL